MSESCWDAINRDVWSPERREALTKRLARHVAEGRDTEVAEALKRLVEEGLRAHAEDREASWSRLVSPLRIALHLARSTRLPLGKAKHKKLVDFFWKHAGSTPASRRALAHDPHVPGEIQLRVAGDKNHETRQALAENPGITPEVVTKLAADRQSFIRYRAARHPAATAAVLARLAKDKDRGTREGVADHPNAGQALLVALAKREGSAPGGGICQALARNRACPAKTLAAIARIEEWESDTREWAFVELGENPSTPPETLAFLATIDGEPRVRTAVAKNPRTPVAALRALAKLKPIPEALASNPSTPDAILAELASSRSPQVRHAATATRRISAKELARLAKSKDKAIRAGVAANPKTPLDVLTKLARDPDANVRCNVVIDERVRGRLTNSYTAAAWKARGDACRVGPDVLRTLARDKNKWVRMWVSETPKTPPDVLELLAKDKESVIRDRVLRNPNLPAGHRRDVVLAEERRALAEERRVLPLVRAGKGDARTLARGSLTSPQVLGLLALRHAIDVAENARLYLEDVIVLPKVKAKAKTVTTPKRTEVAKTWSPSGEPGPLTVGVPPKSGLVPRWTLKFAKSKSTAPIDRAGGLPSAWAGDAPWPTCMDCLQPMTFALQIIGKAGGGHVDLGDAAALQVFACNSDEGCCADEPGSGTNAAILRREPLAKHAAALPESFPCDLEEGYTITRKADHDDARLEEPGWYKEDEEGHERAWDHANCEKIGGIATYGNKPTTVECPTCKKKLEFFGKFWHVFQPFGSGTAYLHICPSRHVVTYQAVN